MNLYFAHEGVEHSSTVEAVSHGAPSDLPVILSISAVVLVVILVAAKLLSIAGRPDPKEKES